MLAIYHAIEFHNSILVYFLLFGINFVLITPMLEEKINSINYFKANNRQVALKKKLLLMGVVSRCLVPFEKMSSLTVSKIIKSVVLTLTEYLPCTTLISK